MPYREAGYTCFLKLQPAKRNADATYKKETAFGLVQVIRPSSKACEG